MGQVCPAPFNGTGLPRALVRGLVLILRDDFAVGGPEVGVAQQTPVPVGGRDTLPQPLAGLLAPGASGEGDDRARPAKATTGRVRRRRRPGASGGTGPAKPTACSNILSWRRNTNDQSSSSQSSSSQSSSSQSSSSQSSSSSSTSPSAGGISVCARGGISVCARGGRDLAFFSHSASVRRLMPEQN